MDKSWKKLFEQKIKVEAKSTLTIAYWTTRPMKMYIRQQSEVRKIIKL